VIVVDALRADALSCYGAPLRTPHVDAFAAEGYVFENAFTCAPQTNLSVMSLFTSQYPTVHKARLDTVASPRWETVAEVLSRHGYRCRAVVGNEILRPYLGYDRGFDDYELVFAPGRFAGFELTAFAGLYNRAGQVLSKRGATPAITEWVTRRTLEFLDDYDRAEPFFLYVHYMDPHMPYTPPAKYVRGGRALRERALRKLAADAHLNDTYVRTDTDVLRALYAGEVSYVDDRLAEVFSTLRRRGLLENTFVVITADHGEEFREHGGLGHHTHYREVVRVPLVVKAPAGPLAGKGRYGGAVSLADLAPTIYGFLGVRPPAALEGRDLAALVAAPAEDRFVYSEGNERADEPKALHSCRYTVIEDRDAGSVETYDRAVDPGERRNLYRLERTRPEGSLAALRKKCAAVDAKAATSGEAVKVALAEDEKSKLRALGYLQD
jgi:arylsulfatase A-like enzyme